MHTHVWGESGTRAAHFEVDVFTFVVTLKVAPGANENPEQTSTLTLTDLLSKSPPHAPPRRTNLFPTHRKYYLLLQVSSNKCCFSSTATLLFPNGGAGFWQRAPGPHGVNFKEAGVQRAAHLHLLHSSGVCGRFRPDAELQIRSGVWQVTPYRLQHLSGGLGGLVGREGGGSSRAPSSEPRSPLYG